MTIDGPQQPPVSQSQPQTRRPDKIFGLGLSRTGTTSLNEMLCILGWRSVHWPVDERTVREIEEGQLRLSILDEYDALTDCALPIVAYRRYADLYPQAKFILTVRDVESWLVSIRRHWLAADAKYDWWADQRPFVRAARNYRYQVFGHLGFDGQHFRNIYSQHWQNVLLAFRNQTWRLLVYDVRDGWGPVCRFLGVAEPGRVVPHLNRGAQSSKS